MKKIVINRKPPQVKPDRYTLVLDEPITDEESEITYTPIKGTDYAIGFDNEYKHFVYDPMGETGWEHLTGWAWYTDRKVMLRNFARFLASEEPLPKIEGKPDKRWASHILIAVADAPQHAKFPFVDLAALPPKSTTVIRFDPKEKAVVSLLTKDSDGVWLGWSSCGSCNRQVTRCECPKGCRPNPAIYWSCERSADGWSNDYRPGKSYVPTSGSNTMPVRIGTAPLSRPVAARKTATHVPVAIVPTEDVTGVVAGLDAGGLDMDALTKAAEASAEASTKAVRRVVRRKK